MNLYYLVRARWQFVVATFAAVVGVSLLATALSPTVYSSQAHFAVLPEVFSLYANQESAASARLQLEASQLQMVRSASVLTNVIQHLKLDQLYARREGRPAMSAMAAMEILSANLDVGFDPRTELITVTVFDRDRDMAAAIANQIPTEINELHSQHRRQLELRGLATLKNELKRMEAEVAEAKARIQDMGVTIQIPVK